MIDLYEKEDLKYVLLVFILGGLSVLVVELVHLSFLDDLGFHLNGSLLNDFLYSVFGIGAVEEFAKIIPFVFFYTIFKKEANEPIDILFYTSVSALGFSAVENMLYFSHHGPSIIDGRAILSTLTHMFCSAIIAYGIIRSVYFHKKKVGFEIIGYFLLAALSHGFFDFWLIYKPFGLWGTLVSVAYFLVTISLFAGILNNAINNSEFFTYEKVISASRVSRKLVIYYAIVFLIQLLLLIYFRDFIYAIQNFTVNMIFVGMIVFITIMRMSRFTLMRNEWAALPIEFPMRIYLSPVGKIKIGIRGNPYEDILGQGYYKTPCILSPISAIERTLRHPRKAIAVKKLWLLDGEPCYLLDVENPLDWRPPISYLITAKVEGTTEKAGFPIVGVYEMKKEFRDIKRISPKDLTFIEWGYLKPDIPTNQKIEIK